MLKQSLWRSRLGRIAALGFMAAVCIAAIVAGTPKTKVSEGNTDWPVYGGSPENTHYSKLNQINRSNVSKLALAWSYDSRERRLGDLAEHVEARFTIAFFAGEMWRTTRHVVVDEGGPHLNFSPA